MNTANARPTPIIFRSIVDSDAKIENTATMITAALVTTPAPREMPPVTASPVARPRDLSSAIRLSTKTW